MTITAPRVGFQDPETGLGKMLRNHLAGFTAIRVSRDQNIYSAGEMDNSVYFIETGSVMVLWRAPGGSRELVTIYGAGDLFGELSLGEQTARLESAVAAEDACILQIPCDAFMAMIESESLLIPMARLLALLNADRRQTIATLLAARMEEEVAAEHKLVRDL